MTYRMNLEAIRDVIPCRNHYKVGNSYCAWGKVLLACDLPVPIKMDDYFHAEASTQEFFNRVLEAMGKEWVQEIANLNDSTIGTLRENHEKALDRAILGLLNAGLVEIAEPCGRTTNP